MKVALVAPPYFSIPPTAYGGVEAVVADLADALVDRGHDVTLLCAGPSGTRARDHLLWAEPQSARLGEALVEIVHAGAVHRAIAEIAATDGLDIVHEHTLAGALLAPAHPVPTVLTCHGPMLADVRRLYGDMAPHLGLVAISHRQRQLAPDAGWVGTVHNAVRAADWPMRTTAPGDGEFALFLGRLHPDKAPHLAMDAAHAAGLPIVLAGKCSEALELDYLEREVRPRLRERDVLFGMADATQKRDLLVRARCMLMPIVWEEPFGMVLIEAAVCGTPVVALRAGAVPEIVVEGVTGFVCDDLDAFTLAIGQVGHLDPQACRDHAVANFGVERMAEGYERAYASAIALRRTPEERPGRVNSPLDPAAAPVSPAEGTGLTLVNGTTFALSGRGGDITGPAQGLFARDTRIVSRLRLEIDGRTPEALAVVSAEPDAAVVVSRVHPPAGRHDSFVLLERHRKVSRRLTETLVLRNFSAETMTAELRLEVRTDFADLFAVKDGRARHEDYLVRPQALAPAADVPDTEVVAVLGFGAATSTGPAEPGSPGLVVAASGRPGVANGWLSWKVVLEPRSTWTARVELRPAFAPDDASAAQERITAWLDPETPADDVPGRVSAVSSSAPRLQSVLRQAAVDLRSLELYLPGASMPALAAGAPWFMTLFGRDSLLAGYMALPLHPAVLTGALETLAALQGRGYDSATEEQPGRILHELRLGAESARAIGGRCYFGSADSTPLFVMMLAEAWRWGAASELVGGLLAAADAALRWCREEGDRDGFISYARINPEGLINQGWKDSFDGVSDAAGRMPTYPVALCEVQAYHYRALLDRAALAEAGFGDPAVAEHARAQAAALRARFAARFWLADRGWPALALDATEAPLDALTSNAAHCLWAGLLDDEQAETVVAALAGADMTNGWGLRTLSSDMAAYNPMSYHNGSVWPHDTALAVAGLAAYAHVPGALPLAHRLAEGLLDAAASFGGRLPELLCGFARDEYAVPVPYPTSCSPQAWASAAPLLLVRALLGLRPDAPGRAVRLDPQLPPSWGTVEIAGLDLGGTPVSITASGTSGSITGLPADWTRTP